MDKLRTSYLAVLLFFSAAVLLNVAVVAKRFPSPLPSGGFSPLPEYVLFDFTARLWGVRRLASDIAWVQLLQYYGSPEHTMDREAEYELSLDLAKLYLGFSLPGDDDGKECRDTHCRTPRHYHADYEGGVYAQLLRHCLRVTDLDPFYSYAYLYGAGALAWNLDRPDEAISLLQKGISVMERYSAQSTNDPQQPYWQYHLYISAIIYRKIGDPAKMLALLETAVRQPDCPNMMKVILANIYQKEEKLIPALKLWIDIYDSNDPVYRSRSQHKLEELRSILHL